MRKIIIRKILLLIAVISLATVCKGQNDIIIPSEFIEIKPPKVSSNDWYGLNHSNNEFEVKVINSSLIVRKTNEENKCELKIPSGTLYGINNGEWGGKLFFVPSTDSAKSITIKSGNIKFIFSYRNQIYFIEGLAHLGINEGALYKLNIEKNNGFTYGKILVFEDAPEAFTVYNDKILVATHKNFYMVTDFKKELICKDTFWSSLYPNSIAVIDDNNVFIGMRGGIARLDLKKRTLRFYKFASAAPPAQTFVTPPSAPSRHVGSSKR